MKAWEYERDLLYQAVPTKEVTDNKESWMKYVSTGCVSDNQLLQDWSGEVPGSKAPSDVVIAAIQCMHNKGYEVSAAEQYMESGLKALKEKNCAALQRETAKIFRALNEAEKNEQAEYWKYDQYLLFSDIEAESIFPEQIHYDVFTDEYEKKIKAGWMGQLIGGCIGTQIEGYVTNKIRDKFGEITGYLRDPETYNDDITYEIAYLDAFCEKGYDVTADDVAFKWLEHIYDGYSAERIALENLRRGIFPPQSGILNNYFSDCIGAQMRTMIHGMVAPGDAALAARLAADDSIVSHSNNGMLGGVFNAILISLSFVETDIRTLLYKAIDAMPHKSEYYHEVAWVLDACIAGSDWETVWAQCEKRYIEYNWIHSYPNAAAEIVALWFGDMDFDRTCTIIAMEGQDVDCTAAPVLNALAIMQDLQKIDEKWIEPIGEDIHTTMRCITSIKIDELCRMTVEAVRRACADQTKGA